MDLGLAGKVAALVGATAVGVIVSNIDRGSSLAVLRGVPWVALIVISAVAGVVLQYSNPTSAQATLSKHDATRL